MRYRLIFLLIMVSALVAGPARAEESKAPYAASTLAQAPDSGIPLRGALFRVRFHDHTCYLFGTIHVGQADFFPLEQQVTQAFAKAGTFMLEIDMRNAESLQLAAKNSGTIAAHLTQVRHFLENYLWRR